MFFSSPKTYKQGIFKYYLILPKDYVCKYIPRGEIMGHITHINTSRIKGASKK